MTTYVDPARWPFKNMLMCHMWADTRDELFVMANLIGVQLKWFQRPPGTVSFGIDASWEHFDIAQTKRALAIQYGAVETDAYGPLRFRALQMMRMTDKPDIVATGIRKYAFYNENAGPVELQKP